MIDKIKYIAKLSSSALFSYLKISFAGNLNGALAFTCGLIFFIFQLNGESSGGGDWGSAGGVGAVLGVIYFFCIKPVQCTLLTLIIVSTTLLNTRFAGSYVFKKTLNKIIRDKSESILYPLLDKVIAKLKNNPAIKTGVDASVIKMQLIDGIKKETENKWVKRILIYGFKKLKIDDIDFNQSNLDMYEVIKIKTMDGIKTAATPSKKNFWLTIGFHWVAVLIIALMKYV